MSTEAFKFYDSAEGAGMNGKYTTPFCNLLINRPVRSEDSKVDYDENGEPIGFGSINFRVRCMGEDNGHGSNFPVYPLTTKIDRKWLNERIINHFYYREIGVESIAQFCHRFTSTMQEIMPKYNHMFDARSELFDKDLQGNYIMLFGRYDNFKEEKDGDDTVYHGKTLTRDGDIITRAIDENGTYGGAITETNDQPNTKRTMTHQGINDENPEKNTSISLTGNIGSQQYATSHDVSVDTEEITVPNGKESKSTTTTKGGNKTEYENLKDTEGGNTKTEYNSTTIHKGYKDVNALEFMNELPEAYLSVENMIFKDLEPLFMQIF